MLRAELLHVTDDAHFDPAGAAWRSLEARLRPFVARRVLACDVDDVLQDVFVRLARGLDALRDDERLAPWAFSIARNVVTDHHRRTRRDPVVPPLSDYAAPDVASDADARDDRLEGELLACVAHFVATLPDDHRQAITLVELEGVSQKDAAAILGLSHSGMKSRVQRGRAELRAMFARACTRIELDARRKVIDCEPRGCGLCASTERVE